MRRQASVLTWCRSISPFDWASRPPRSPQSGTKRLSGGQESVTQEARSPSPRRAGQEGGARCKGNCSAAPGKLWHASRGWPTRRAAQKAAPNPHATFNKLHDVQRACEPVAVRNCLPWEMRGDTGDARRCVETARPPAGWMATAMCPQPLAEAGCPCLGLSGLPAARAAPPGRPSGERRSTAQSDRPSRPRTGPPRTRRGGP